MKIAGGVYVERCLVPEWRQVFGSGGRAAATITIASLGTELHTYCAQDYLADAEATLAAFGVQFIATTIDTAVYFSYFQPISNPEIDPLPSQMQRRPSLRVAGDVVLRFGFMEGDAVIEADRAIYDPQSGLAPERFHANGSKAGHLAIVLNEGELAALTGLSDQAEAAETLMAAERAEVVVVKAGTRGATVYAKGSKPTTVPAYRSRRVFKIGSGDVFTATFARRWGEERHDPVDAADWPPAAPRGTVRAARCPCPLSRNLKPSLIGPSPEVPERPT